MSRANRRRHAPPEQGSRRAGSSPARSASARSPDEEPGGPPGGPPGRRGGVAVQERPGRADRPVEVGDGTGGEGRPAGFSMPRIDVRGVAAGFVAGELLLLLVTNIGLHVADAAFGPTSSGLDGGIVGVGTFVAVIVGGFVAARVASRGGVWQGTMVGICFIAVAMIYDLVAEAQLVHSSFAVSGGARSLIDLGPMRIDQVFTGDLLALFGGSVGGHLARRR